MEIPFNDMSVKQINDEIECLSEKIIFFPGEFQNHIDLCILFIIKKDYLKASKYFFALLNNVPTFSTIRRILKKEQYNEILLNLDIISEKNDFQLMKAYFLYFLDYKELAKSEFGSINQENCSYDGFYWDLLQYVLFEGEDFENEEQRINNLLGANRCRGIVYNLAGLFYDVYGFFNKAVYFFSLAIKNNSKCEDYYKNRGSLFFDKKKYKVAIRDYKIALKLNPCNADTYGLLGVAMFDSKKYPFEVCESVIEKGILVNPDDPCCYIYLYEIYKNKSNSYGKCHDILCKLISFNPDNDQYYFERSKLWLYPVQYKNAIADLEKAISIKPENFDYYRTYALVLKSGMKYQDAIEALKKCLDISPTWSYLNLEIAYNYFFLKEFEKSVEYIKKEEVSTWDKEYFYILGYSLFKLERFEEAIYYFSKGIEYMGASDLDFVLYSLLHSGRGVSYKRLGETNKSVKDFITSNWVCDLSVQCDPLEMIQNRFPEELRDFN